MILKNKLKQGARYKVQGTRRGRYFRLRSLFLVPCALLLVFFHLGGCGIYRFNDTSVPDSIKTIKINYIENRAAYVNPQLSPRLSDKLRQKIVSQTRLSQTNNDNADWEVSGFVREYSLSTVAISAQKEATNRLTVTIHLTKYDRKTDKTDDIDVSRNFDFSATQSLPQAEAILNDEMIRSLTDDIFNRLFSKW